MSIAETNNQRGPTLRERVAEVHRLRLLHAVVKAEVERRREAWEEQNREWLNRVASYACLLAAAEAEAKDAAAEIFLATGDKHPAPGATVVERKQPSYDVPDAIKWAREHGHSDLVREVLDEKAFQKVALALAIPCVTWRTVAVGQLATDLGKALEEATQDG